MFYELLPQNLIKKGLQMFLNLWDQMKTTLFHNLAPFTHRGRAKGKNNKQTKNKNKQTDLERKESKKAAQEYCNNSR
jgi:hypothetical protein